MRTGGTGSGRFGQLVLAALVSLAGLPTAGHGQIFFNNAPAVQRPPADVPSVPPGPAQSLAPPAGNPAPPAAKSSPPPPAGNPASSQGTPAVPAGQVPLTVSARFGRDMPAINGGLHWRVYKPDQTGTPRLVKEDKGAAPVFTLPPGSYVVSATIGLASVAKAVQLRGDATKEVLEVPAGGLRIEGRVGDVRIPPGQISFELYRGSQFEAGDKRPIAQAVMTGDVVLVPEGSYHIVSNYGDGNSVVRSDILVQAGKLTDAAVNHRAAIITLKLVNERGGEARANTQWSVLTPGGDVIKESVVGAFPRVILAEGEYRTIARNEGKTYEGEFRVVNGVDREVEIVAR